MRQDGRTDRQTDRHDGAKIYEYPSNGSRVVTCGKTDGQTDRQTDMMKPIVVFRNFVNDVNNF